MLKVQMKKNFDIEKLIKNGEVSAYKAIYDRSDSKKLKGYHFHIESVEAFERFCELSGGFEIC